MIRGSFFSIITGVLILLIPTSLSAKDGELADDPNGFKGYTWNTPVTQFHGLALWNDSGETKTYYLPDEPLTIDDINIQRIVYVFLQDRLKRVVITFRKFDNYQALLDALTKRFGVGLDLDRFSHDVSWTGENTSMLLTYDSDIKTGALVVSHVDFEP